MPITRGAKKALRAAVKKRHFNIARKQAVKDVTKELKKLAIAGNKKDAEALLSKTFKALDKAAKGNTISKGNASRRKSRLSALVKKIA
jgi:ribosomal protein S20